MANRYKANNSVIEDVEVVAKRIRIPDITIDQDINAMITADIKSELKSNAKAGIEAISKDIEEQNDRQTRRERKKGFKIDTLRYNFDQGARPNRYSVNLYCPNLNINLEGIRCINATLPGRQLESADWSPYGPTEKRPYQLSMDGQEVSFTFLCDSNFADRYIIDAWLGAIFSGGKKDENNDFNTQGSSINPMFSYYNDYIGQIEIMTMSNSANPGLSYKLESAFPISYNPMSLAYDQTDSILQFECTFAFRTFSTTYHNTPVVNGLNKGRRALDALLDITNLSVFGREGNSANNTLQRFSDRLAKLGGIFD